jgi:hypothetical protein
MLYCRGRKYGVRSGGERSAERVSDRLENVSGMVVDRLADKFVMAAKRRAHGGRIFLPQSGRSLDVGEQQGDDTSGNPRFGCLQPDGPQLYLWLWGLPFEIWALLKDRLFETCQTWWGDKSDLRQLASKALKGPNGFGLPSASIERQHQTFAQTLVERLFEHFHFG